MQSQDKSKHIGSQLNYGNIFGSLAVVVFGAFLVLSGPLFNFYISIGRLPPIVAQIVGAVAIVVGVLGLIFLDKKQSQCLTCKVGFEEGEAAFPEEMDAQTRPLVRSLKPAKLMDAPVGSRFGNGTHFEFQYCPKCKSVGELSLQGLEGKGLELDKVLVLGEAAQQFAHICEAHEKVRDANNAGD